MFTNVQRLRSFEGVVEQIRGVILRGEVQPGGRLPAERDLAAQLGVSRTTLREGLRALESQGLVEIRLGSTGGIFATVPDGQMVGTALNAMMHLRHASHWEMQEYRRDFEPRNAAMAAARASESDFDRLRAAAAAFRAVSADASAVEAVRLKCDVHEAVAEATRNEVRCSIMAALSQTIIRDFQDRPGSLDHGALRRAGEDFERLIEAIAAADADRAAMLMRQRLIWI